jgi:transposase InsO family protein
MVIGLPEVEKKGVCDTCIITKQRRAPFPTKANYQAATALDLVHGDLCGPISPATPSGRQYILLLVDDTTGYMWLKLLTAKSDTAAGIKEIKAATELEVGRPLRVLRTDNGGEFTAKEFAAYCANEGIQRHFSAPYTPQQNGIVERQNQTVLGTARVLLKESDAGTILGGGGHHCRLPAELCSNQGAGGKNTFRGVHWKKADGRLPPHFQLPRLCQGQAAGTEEA